LQLNLSDSDSGRPLHSISSVTYVEACGQNRYYIEYENGGTMEVRGVQITQIQKE
jgi:hypothetical protein